MTTEGRTFAADFCLHDAMWQRMEGLLPKFRQSKKGGRPRLGWRQVLNGIFYVLRTGCQWKFLPPEFGSGSSAHRYFQLLVMRKIFEKLWAMALEEYDQLHGLQWKWQSMDGAMTKAPLGGEKTGPNPIDRAKLKTKRSLMNEGNGLPIGLAACGANTHDKRLVDATLESMPLQPPDKDSVKQHMCMDKGYDAADVRSTLVECGYVPHVLSRGEEKRAPWGQSSLLEGSRAAPWGQCCLPEWESE